MIMIVKSELETNAQKAQKNEQWRLMQQRGLGITGGRNVERGLGGGHMLQKERGGRECRIFDIIQI